MIALMRLMTQLLNADYNGMSYYISSTDRLSVLTTKLTSDLLWEAIGTIMQQAIDTCVPVKHVGTNNSAKCNRWCPAAVKRAVARNHCLWRKHREKPDDSKILRSYRKANHTYREEVCKFEIKCAGY